LIKKDLTDNNSLKNRKEPIAAFFAYADADKYDLYQTDNNAIANICNDCQERLIQYLRAKGHPVVSDKDPRAMYPRAIVVTKSGIQMPFMEPDEARKYARNIQEDIEDSGFARPLGLVHGVTIDQLSPPVLRKQLGSMTPENFAKQCEQERQAQQKKQDEAVWDDFLAAIDGRGAPSNSQKIEEKPTYQRANNGLEWSQKRLSAEESHNLQRVKTQSNAKSEPQKREKTCNFHWTKHPDGGFRDFIELFYGKEFLNNMKKEALANSVDMSAEMAKSVDIGNMGQYLYSGRAFTNDPHTIHPRNNMESKCGVYATPSLEKACYYAKQYGIVQIYKKSKNQEYYDDYGIERGKEVSAHPSANSETLIRNDENEYVGTYLYLGENRCFKIPENDERWEAFLEFFRAAYLPEESENQGGVNYMEERRKNILSEAKQNGNKAKTTVPFGYSVEEIEILEVRESGVLEDYLLTPMSRIRKKYAKYIEAVKGKLRQERNKIGLKEEEKKRHIEDTRKKEEEKRKETGNNNENDDNKEIRSNGLAENINKLFAKARNLRRPSNDKDTPSQTDKPSNSR